MRVRAQQRTSTVHPFWMALPTEASTPGYLSNSARDTRIMNPSGSVLVHEILGKTGVCSQRHPSTGLPPLVVDVGAHVGWFSMLAASYGCRVIAFEPQPHAHPFLNATITLNGWQGRVRTVWGAVSSGEAGGKPVAKMKMVNRHGWDNWDVTELVPLNDPDDGDEVPVWRVDDFVDEVSPHRPSPFNMLATDMGTGSVA
jgi:FkbM family methyltransferase